MTIRAFTALSRALADETRVRVLLVLRQKELCACQITELFRLAPSTMSQHMSLLKQAGLVNSRKQGRWIYYSLPGRIAPKSVQEALRWVHRNAAGDPRAVEDDKRLQKILQLDPVELCKKQCRR